MEHTHRSAALKGAPALMVGAIGQVVRWAIVPMAAVGAIPVLDVATGGPGGAAVLAALADPLAVLAARSPGARPEGALTQSKRRKATAPEQHDLTKLTRPLERLAAPGDIVPEAVADAVADAAEPVVAAAAAPAVIVADPLTRAPIAIGLAPAAGLVINPDPAGAPATSTTGPTPTPTPTPTVPVPVVAAAVPEPATWFTLLVGFGAIGGALRSRRRLVASASSHALARAARG